MTTLPKAKELRPFAERAITLGKRALGVRSGPRPPLHARRLAAGYFYAGNTNRAPTAVQAPSGAERTAGVLALEKLFDDLAARFADRPGGYTRILKLGRAQGRRRRDGVDRAGRQRAEGGPEEAKPEEKKGRRFFGRGKKSKRPAKKPDDKPEESGRQGRGEGPEEGRA